MILPCITTTQETGNSWQEKIKEIKKFNVKKIALFPTIVNQKQRKEIYKKLNKIKGLEIPFMHIRDDFDEKEIAFVIKKYKTKIFNNHSKKEYPTPNVGKFQKMVCLENTWCKIDDEIENYAGLCIDFAHLESQKIEKNPLYKYFKNITKKYKVKCAHIATVKKGKTRIGYIDGVGKVTHYHFHTYSKLSDFNYLKKYKNLMPGIIALELENTIEEQLIAKKYIEKILK